MNNLDRTWKTIKENNFHLINPLNEDLICLICQMLMVNATNAPCGCRYCYDCIKKCLDKTDNYCPGLLKYCKLNLINFDRDICIDRSINIRISQLMVKCPMETCEFKDELNMIDEHLKDCDKKFIGCPYSDIGCCKYEVRQNEVIKHLSNDSFTHNKLLVEYVNNLRNEIEELNSKISTIKKENVSVIENLESTKKNLELEHSKLKKDYFNLFVNENKKMKDQINLLNSKIESFNRDQKHEQLEKDLKLFKEKQEKIEEDVNKFQEKNEQLCTLVCVLNESVKNLDEDIENFIDDVNENYITIDNCDDKLDIIKEQLNNYTNKVFIWKIENLSKMIEDAKTNLFKKFFSDSFFVSKNGYKMILCASPYGCGKSKGYFGLYFAIMKGPHDDILSWPCKIDVTLELVNQDDGLEYISKTKSFESKPFHIAYQKPKSDINESLGIPYLIKLDYLLKQTKVIKNNQLFIRCTVCLNK